MQELLDALTAGGSPILQPSHLRKGLQDVLNNLGDVAVDVPFAPTLVGILPNTFQTSLQTNRTLRNTSDIWGARVATLLSLRSQHIFAIMHRQLQYGLISITSVVTAGCCRAVLVFAGR